MAQAWSESAFLFTGQGAQYVGMGERESELCPEVPEALAEADEALGESLSSIVREGPEAALTLTENAQPAILALCVGHYRVARRLGLKPAVLLGHSLGEYGAWVAAGSLEYDDAIRLVRLRGQAMQEAVPVGVGGMSAIISAPSEEIERLCQAVTQSMPERVVQIAVYNSPGNVVVSGHLDAVSALEGLVGDERLGIVRRLSVSAPFHSSLLKPAADRLRSRLESLDVKPNNLPVVANVTGGLVPVGSDASLIRALLVKQVEAPVRWEQSLRCALELEGVESALLFGPGKSLRSHLKRVSRRFPSLSFDGVDGLQKHFSSHFGVSVNEGR